MSRRPTQFTRESAERIANVVRAVEAAAPAARPLVFDRAAQQQNPKNVRICTFTGTWSIGSTNTVTVGTAPNTSTVSAVNLFFPLTSGGNRTGAIAKDGTAWYLIDVPLRTASAIFVTATGLTSVLTGVSFDVNNCRLNTQSVSIITVAQTMTATYLQIGQ